MYMHSTCPLIRRDSVTKEDPACEHHLYWSEPPKRVLVVKKFRDPCVTEKFKVLTTWLVKVTITFHLWWIIVTQCAMYAINNLFSQECDLKVSVERSVLSEETVMNDDTYKDIKEAFITWDDSKFMIQGTPQYRSWQLVHAVECILHANIPCSQNTGIVG